MSKKRENISQIRDLTQGSITTQLLHLAMPLMAIGFIQMGYNLIDLIWIGRLGSKSSAAVGTIGMLMWMMNSVALISKVSAEITIGQSIGAKMLDKASIYASHTTTIALLFGLFFTILFFIFPETIISFFKLSPEISLEAKDYLLIVSLGLPFMFLTLNFSGIYVGAGKSQIPFYFNASGLLLNIILDPLLIFGLGPIPTMGTRGAALATLISMILVLLLFINHLKRKKGPLSGFPFLTRLRRSYTINILKLGLPVAAMNVFFSFINMNLARIASIHGGHLGVASQTTGGQIEGVTWNTSQGFATALGSFVAQNYAAQRMHRAQKAFISTLQIMGVIGLFVTIAFIFFGEDIFSIFIPEEAAYKAGGEYLAIMGVSQLFMMLELTTQGMFNGIGRTTPPAIISITFNLIRIPLAIILASSMGVTGVWWAISISTILKGTILPLWYLSLKKRNFK